MLYDFNQKTIEVCYNKVKLEVLYDKKKCEEDCGNVRKYRLWKCRTDD